MGRRDHAIAQYETALRIDPNSFMAHYNCGVALRGETRIAEARTHFARAFALKPDFLEAELALCMAELPALYQDASEIAAQRDAYARRLARLSADVERARAPAVLAEAVGSHQPFYLPYQGRNDRELQVLYGALVCKMMAARYATPVLPNPPGPHQPIRLGIVSGFFRQHSNWKIPIKGWLKNLDRNPVGGFPSEQKSVWFIAMGIAIARSTGRAEARRAGEAPASAFAAAMNIASVTRRAFTAITPSPMPGKI